MSMLDLPVIDALKQRMRWLTTKQSVIAENVANAGTPGYRPRALEEQNFQDLLTRTSQAGSAAPSMSMSKTNDAHLGVGGAPQGRGPNVERATFLADERPDGNGVVLEQELIALAETQIEYQTMLGVYRKQTSILKTALGKSSG